MRLSLIYGKEGALGMLIADADFYREATFSKNNPLTSTLFKNTLTKLELLRAFETEIGGDFKIETDLRSVDMNQLCWIINFVESNKKYATTEDKDIMQWIETKQKAFKTNIDQTFGSRRIDNDCRI